MTDIGAGGHIEDLAAVGGAIVPAADGGPVDQPTQPRRTVRRRRAFFGQWGAVVALGWLVLLAVLAIFASLVATHPPSVQDLSHPFAGPSGSHWLGTDDLGRDVFSRLVYGARVSLRVSFEVVGLALVVAIPIGLLSGYRGGQVDNVLMRVMDGGLSFPPLVLALAVVAVLGPGINNTALALAIVFMPSFARLVRGQALAVKEESFIEASRSLGTSPLFILARRMFPNVVSAVIVQASLALGGALLAEAALSFLGLGAQPPAPSWGSMLQEAYNTGLFTHSWSMVAPGAAIASAVLAFNTVGDGLTAALGVTRPSRRRRHGVGRLGRGGPRLGLTTVERQPRKPGPQEALPLGSDPTACLAVEDLTVKVAAGGDLVAVVEDVGFSVGEGEIVGLVGESGSGKSVTSLALMRLLASPPFVVSRGSVRLAGRDLLGLDFAAMRRVRGREMSMIFQDPMSSLNPARPIGVQLSESIRLHEKVGRDAARRRAVELLERVGIPDPAARARSFPHQLSGGMRQRVMIAMALACRPRLLIADEPTTALDVTVQAQILDLLRDLVRTDGLSIIFVTHDLGVVAELCDRVVVLYAGQIVEAAPTAELFSAPRHPYTEGLIAASRAASGRVVTPIAGQVPQVGHNPSGCRFHPRCPYAAAECSQAVPALSDLLLVPASAGATAPPPGRHEVRCWRQQSLSLKGIK